MQMETADGNRVLIGVGTALSALVWAGVPTSTAKRANEMVADR
jgi:hypothetical protein